MQQPETCWIRLAETPLWIQPQSPKLLTFFKDYIIQPTPQEKQAFQALTGGDQPLTVSRAELEQETHWDPRPFPAAYLESLALYRKLCHILLHENILLFHCSALSIHDKAILFTAKSGTGKSTHARLWRERFGPAVTMINDDKPLLKVEPHGVRVYGTPYAGKEGLHSNCSATVAAIVILRQGQENHLKQIPMQQAYPVLFQQSYREAGAEGLPHTLDLVGKLAALPVYTLDCTISQEAVELVYERLKGDGYL